MLRITKQRLTLSDGSVVYNVLLSDRDQTIVFNATNETRALLLMGALQDAIIDHTCNGHTFGEEVEAAH